MRFLGEALVLDRKVSTMRSQLHRCLYPSLPQLLLNFGATPSVNLCSPRQRRLHGNHVWSSRWWCPGSQEHQSIISVIQGQVRRGEFVLNNEHHTWLMLFPLIQRDTG